MLHIDTDRLIEIFLETIKIDALSGREKPLADYIRKFLSSCKNVEITEDKSNKFSNSNTGNIIIKSGSGGNFVMLSHMDTARSTEQLTPIVSENKITSSGNTILGVDNRVGVAVLLYTLEKQLSNGSAKDFTVAFTTCEETTLLGSKNLKLDKNIKTGFVFDSAFRPGNFINSACGAMSFKIKIIGKASHSGIAPEKGVNSIQIAAEALSKIRQGRIDEETTVNIGKIKGGSAVNVIPEITFIEGEVRSFEIKKIEKEIKKIKDIFDLTVNNSSGRVIFEADWDFSPYKFDETSQIYKTTVEVLSIAGLTPEAKVSLGGSDANSLNANGIPAVNLGIGAQNPHSNEELILIEDLVKTAEIAHHLLMKENK